MPRRPAAPARAPKTSGVIEWEGKQLVFNLEDVRVADAVTMTAHAGRPVMEIFRDFAKLDPYCMQAFLWWLLRTNGHQATIETLDFNMFALLNAFNDAVDTVDAPEVEGPKGNPTHD